jgi:hypothetical protein
MHKEIILGILLLLPTVTALKQCTTNYCNDFVIGKPAIQSNSTLYINDMVINIGATTEKKAHLYRIVSGAIITPSGGGGGSIITLYYDVLVNVKKDRYTRDENIEAEIIIINKGHIPDRDGKLTTYLLSPNGTMYKGQSAEFELIPPTCEIGNYDWYEDVCISGDNIYEPKKTVITREIAPPLNAKIGEWKFVVEYETRLQPLIKVYDSFEIYVLDYVSYVILALIILLAYHYRKKGGKR